jgi:hypothetical protein
VTDIPGLRRFVCPDCGWRYDHFPAGIFQYADPATGAKEVAWARQFERDYNWHRKREHKDS